MFLETYSLFIDIWSGLDVFGLSIKYCLEAFNKEAAFISKTKEDERHVEFQPPDSLRWQEGESTARVRRVVFLAMRVTMAFMESEGDLDGNAFVCTYELDVLPAQSLVQLAHFPGYA